METTSSKMTKISSCIKVLPIANNMNSVYTCNGLNVGTGPLARLVLSPVSWVDKVRLYLSINLCLYFKLTITKLSLFRSPLLKIYQLKKLNVYFCDEFDKLKVWASQKNWIDPEHKLCCKHKVVCLLYLLAILFILWLPRELFSIQIYSKAQKLLENQTNGTFSFLIYHSCKWKNFKLHYLNFIYE